MPERRKAPRFRVALPVELPEGTGVTRDLSVCGVFLETERLFALGEVIQFALILQYVDPSRPVRLHCRGQVVRVEPRGQGIGLALAITEYRFNGEKGGGKGLEALGFGEPGHTSPLA
ncbi:MAG TPA: PilZ domain-containing protein [Candidatus Tectomicrobia bacterium]|nr:PilZ domain-containing protein [Candidatus Tectomicrobia bacterium]